MLKSLQQDVAYLNSIRAEVDKNTELLLKQDYRVEIKLGEPLDLVDVMKKAEKKVGGVFPIGPALAMQALRNEKTVPVLQLKMPREMLVDTSFDTQAPQLGDISFDLTNDINDYQRRVRRINLTIHRLLYSDFQNGIALKFQEDLLTDIKYHNSQVDDLSKLDMVKLKNRINTEIQRLAERRKALTSSIAGY
ncbi:hypothetical protein AZ34_11780 [Hylemonella gracilis str. Niagara R]|uniref:Uncharacterized protein n=1 Tax=Hylemonella gracilis str. Niagara R TaxID=1458275 RepID=A0A016XMS7_9BURK|nr:hypothetical protein AZ34_11780 [Hylemonella gracilis str. Niagara R]